MKFTIKAFFVLISLMMCLLFASCGEHDHVWINGRVTKEPTETDYGIMTYTCKRCDEKYTQLIARLPHTHTYGNEWNTDPVKHWKACGFEGCTIAGDKGNHKWDEGEIIVEANQTTPGKRRHSCVTCGYQTEKAYAAYPIVNKEEWNKAITPSVFQNVTYTIGDRESPSRTKIMIGEGYIRIEENGSVSYLENTNVNIYGSHYLLSLLEPFINEYDSFIYDEGSKTYSKKADGVTYALQFSNGYITFVSIIDGESATVINLSSYGRTEFTLE